MAYLEVVDTITRITRAVPLRKAIVAIGRAAGNDVVLDDGAIAASHLNLLTQGGVFTASVLNANNLLYINGEETRSKDIHFGDRIQVGRFELILHDAEPPAEESGDGEDALDWLRQVVDFSQQLMGDTTPETLFHMLLRSVVQLTGAEKGFIIVLQDGQLDLASSHNVGDESPDLSRVSDSIVQAVVETHRPIIVSDAMNDRKFSKAKSVVDLRLSSVMCVPLLYRDDLLGAIYLGNDRVTNLFNQRDLDLLQVYASQASMIVHTALMLNELKTSNRNLRSQLERAGQGSMIGSCGPMQTTFRVIRKVAPTDLSVLILGETGTGKELVAREVHRLSGRKKGPFISINCGAIPENLLESELFGHKKGAFTGAVADKVGKFEAAMTGTIFLDEIGEMPANLQVKLLRVLQERTIERVGDLQPRPIDIRVVAATNKDLEEEIKEGRFREDLLYRLNEVTVDLPPLRDRGDDIVQLARYFLNQYADQYSSRARGFTNESTKAMKAYFWPGNVRQLESRIKKAVIMSDRALLNSEDLGILKSERRHIRPLAEAEEAFKLQYVREILEMNNWNKAQTARDLDVDPRTVFRYIEKFDDVD